MDSIDSLKQLVERQFEVPSAKIDPDVPFSEYDIDSLSLAELMFAVEDQFRVQVPDQALSAITNLRGLAGLVDQLCATQGA